MAYSISIVLDGETIAAELDETPAGTSVYNALPIECDFNTWGDEIYFSIPLSLTSPDMVETVGLGDIAYWPPGKAFCIFYGATPMSGPGEIRPASDVILLGRVTGDSAIIKHLANASTLIRIEKS